MPMLIKTPISDADINATLKGDIDLANISKLVPLEAGTSLKGALKANITAIEGFPQSKIKNMNNSMQMALLI